MVAARPSREGPRPHLGELLVPLPAWPMQSGGAGGRSEPRQDPNSQQQSDGPESSGRGVLPPLPSQGVVTSFRGHVQPVCACVHGGEAACSEATASS